MDINVYIDLDRYEDESMPFVTPASPDNEAIRELRDSSQRRDGLNHSSLEAT